MRVISCESVRCSAAARRRGDSFRWLGTYAPIKTPLRLAIYPPLSNVRFDPANAEQVCKPNSVLRLLEVAIIHLVQPLPTGSSDLPGGVANRSSLRAGSPFLTPPYLVLQR